MTDPVQQPSQQQQQQNNANNPNFDSNVISERVKNLATQIYQELKRIISRCNYDEDILSGLMPLIVRVLESLDLALIENQQLQVEVELSKDDNEQLLVMLGKEKAAKRISDKKLIESEYAYEEERQQYQQKIESLDGVVKMMELKAKNASDQAARFEEKEIERKKEYQKLHDRYTELLKSHCDVVERVRHLVGNQEVANLNSINVPQHIIAGGSSDQAISDVQQQQQSTHQLNSRMKHSKADDIDTENKNSLSYKATRDTLRSWNAETELEDASLIVIDDVLGTGGHTKPQQTQLANQTGDASSHNESDRLTSSEFDGGEQEKESENDSIAYTSMEKEFRKLIQDNKDLLNTKNALNVVKDDLIAEVDRLTNEVSMYEQAVEQLNGTKEQMKQKVNLLDAELRKTKEELEKAKQKIRENNEEGVPYALRKRFGRAEMAKVLMERNEYKEKFMNLQDAIKYTELVRANKSESEKRSGLWKFFSNLFGAPPREPLAIGPGSGTSLSQNSSPLISYHVGSTELHQQTSVSGSGGALISDSGSNVGGSGLLSSSSIRSINPRLTTNSDLIVLMDSDVNIDRSRALGGMCRSLGGVGSSIDGSSRFMNSEPNGYIHAYGWSLPVSSFRTLAISSNSHGTSIHSTLESGNNTLDGMNESTMVASRSLVRPYPPGNERASSLRVPIPLYCRPLTGDAFGMKIWCATAIDLSGGEIVTTVVEERFSRKIENETSKKDDRKSEHNSLSQSTELSTNMSNPIDQSSGSLVNITSSTTTSTANRTALNQLEREVDEALQESTCQNSESDESQISSYRRGPVSSTPHRRRSSISAVAAANGALIDQPSEELSSCVWICSTQHSRSKITIINMKTKPNELLESFLVTTFLYCIKSVPGTKKSDLPGLLNSSRPECKSLLLSLIEDLIGTQKRNFYQLVKLDKKDDRVTKERLLSKQYNTLPSRRRENRTNDERSFDEEAREVTDDSTIMAATINNKTSGSNNPEESHISRLLDDDISDGITTLEKLNDFVAHTQETNSSPDNDKSSPGSPTDNTPQQESPPSGARRASGPHHHPISTHLPTVWMGGKNSVLYLHSAIGQWGDCIDCVKLRDSILQIFHYRGRVFVALADGTLCVFFRDLDTKQWDLENYLLIDINLLSEISNEISTNSNETNPNPFEIHHPHPKITHGGPPAESSSTYIDPNQEDHTSLSEQLRDATEKQQRQQDELNSSSVAAAHHNKNSVRNKVAGIRCIELANKNLWIGYRNRVLIMDPISLKLKHSLSIIPQCDNQVRQLVAMKDGVFCCLRSDLIMRLYSSLKPYQHIQNIDIEPVVTRLLSPRTFVISHITAMKVVDNVLWIGNAHGIIITIPCELETQVSETIDGTSFDIQDTQGYQQNNNNTNDFLTRLSIAKSVPKCDIANAQISFHGHKDSVKFFVHADHLMLSGGQGYLDFRLDMDDQSKSINDKSHLILWQLADN